MGRGREDELKTTSATAAKLFFLPLFDIGLNTLVIIQPEDIILGSLALFQTILFFERASNTLLGSISCLMIQLANTVDVVVNR